jgi:diketogulonate reductase-like aldo/keto reductase
VALAWATQKYPYIFPIIGGRKVEHLEDNIKSLTVSLSEEQINEIESVVPFEWGFPMDIFGRDPAFTGVPSRNMVRNILHSYPT